KGYRNPESRRAAEPRVKPTARAWPAPPVSALFSHDPPLTGPQHSAAVRPEMLPEFAGPGFREQQLLRRARGEGELGRHSRIVAGCCCSFHLRQGPAGEA